MEFEARKLACLRGIASELPDKSRKGGIDAPIAPLISRINAHPSLFTTSSCSGRLSILLQPPDSQQQLLNQNSQQHSSSQTKKKKKGGEWIYVSHDQSDAQEVLRTVLESCCARSEDEQEELGLLVFRFEPFILAVECLNLSAAQAVVSCAISSGFRESGVTSMGKRIIVAVRCSIRMEVPIAEKGRLLVPEDYVRFLVRIANDKMTTNHQRTDRFLAAFIEQLEGHMTGPLTSTNESSGSLHLSKYSKGRVVRRQFPSASVHENVGESCSGEQHNLKERRFVELEKRQVRVLSRIFVLEAALRETNPALMEGKECKDGLRSDNGRDSTLVDRLDPLNGASGDSRKLELNAMSGSDKLGNDGPVDSEKADISRAVECTGLQEYTSPEKQNGIFNDLEGEGRSSLTGVLLKVLGEPIEKLHRWGHSACVLPCVNGIRPGSLLIFGGYGGPARHSRQNDLLMFDCKDGSLQSIHAENPPTPRMGHTASMIEQNMVVIGGREDPSKSLGDVCVLYLETMKWACPSVRGAQFPPRHRHAAVAVGRKVYVFGGLDNMNVLGDLYVLDTCIMQWTQIECKGEVPPPRHSHSLAAVDQKIYLFGGFDGRRILGDLFVLDLGECTWATVKIISKVPVFRFSHTMTIFNRTLLVLGGCPLAKHANALFLLNVDTMKWRCERMRLSSDCLLVRATASLVENQLVLVGGGASCYAFGTKFSPPFLVDLSCLFPQGLTKSDERAGLLVDNCTNTEEVTRDYEWALKVDKSHAKSCKDTLKHLGWLDLRRKAIVGDEGLHIMLPVTEKAVGHFRCLDGKCMPESTVITSEKVPKEACVDQNLANLMAFELVHLKSFGVRKFSKTPQTVMQEAILLLLQKHGLPASLLHELPKRWERLDDMVVLPGNSFTSDNWHMLGQELWMTVGKSLSAHRVARQAPVAATGTRDSNLQLLLGDNGWVQHRENGILYCFDASKCMFSSGNVSEKLRIASMDCSCEVVVDLFAGIGYFVLPFLMKACARRVYACEWNPPALAALRHNLRVNMVEDRCIVLEGDNRTTAPQGIADRVCLGLLPTSEGSWVVAVKALRPEGGVLHIHGNAKDTEVQQWADYICKSIKNLSEIQGYHWNISVDHMERVKWYAPHIRHVVADVRCEAVKVS